jgi:hypothetical protein
VIIRKIKELAQYMGVPTTEIAQLSIKDSDELYLWMTTEKINKQMSAKYFTTMDKRVAIYSIVKNNKDDDNGTVNQ